VGSDPALELDWSLGSQAARLADWDTALRTGRTLAGPGPKVDAIERTALRTELAGAVIEAEGLVESFTGLALEGFRSRAWVMGRGDWIRQTSGNGTWLVTWIDGAQGLRLLDVERRAVLWEEHFKQKSAIVLPLPMFSPDGRFISLARHDGHDAIWLYETATGKSRVAVSFREPFHIFFRACWVDDGKAVIVNRQQTISHIVLFDRFWVKEATP